MKTRPLLFCTLLFTYSTASAEINEQFPDLSKALKGGILEHVADKNIIEGYVYEYPADLEFDNLKKQLKDFLGEAWQEEKAEPEKDRLLKLIFKAEGIELVGCATFTNPAFPNREISLFQKKEKFEDKQWCIVHLTGSWNKQQPE